MNTDTCCADGTDTDVVARTGFGYADSANVVGCSGYVAGLSSPLTLRVEPGRPVVTDPNATIAWSGGLQPQIKADVSFRTLLGRGGGETFQMIFDGSGFVVVQPFEEVSAVTTA